MNRSNLAYLVVFALATSAACAPRVSKRAPAAMHPDLAPIYAPAIPETKVAKRAEPVVAAPGREQAPVVAEQPKAEPVLVSHSSLDAKPARTERRVEIPTTEEEAPAAKSTAKTNFYAFSDAEVTGLRKRSTDFKKLHDKLKTCTAKSEASIQKREQVRDEIIRLQNEENRTAKMEKQLIALRLEERKLKEQRGQGEDCSKIEVKLTEMLKSAYGAGDTAGARH